MPAFQERLARANAEAKDEATPARRSGGGAKKAEPLAPTRAAEVVNLVSEFLFDLFDANCMEEFQVLEKFELSVVDKFDADADELTFKQEELHVRFVRMMEAFVEKYIQSIGCSLDEFYQAVEVQHDVLGSQGGMDARECLGVLFEMADLRVWVTGMRQRARYRAAHQIGRKEWYGLK
ncbi:hypothetical protein M885DRAFT_508604 [Pelagophyceae sp. CCMP2097]|nr:hypothetical protein M885DRAFT_508604 [Pelagophyceae sp. CCMP2097]